MIALFAALALSADLRVDSTAYDCGAVRISIHTGANPSRVAATVDGKPIELTDRGSTLVSDQAMPRMRFDGQASVVHVEVGGQSADATLPPPNYELLASVSTEPPVPQSQKPFDVVAKLDSPCASLGGISVTLSVVRYGRPAWAVRDRVPEDDGRMRFTVPALTTGDYELVWEALYRGHAVGSGRAPLAISEGCIDVDGDSYTTCAGDCDDTRIDVHPRAKEIYGNRRDDDCDGVNGKDADRDGYEKGGNNADGLRDCDDTRPDVHPQAPEIGNQRDDDCDGLVDEGTGFVDGDGDGVSATAGDCDDDDPLRHPGASELQNCADDDCDGQVDEGLPTPPDAYEPNGSRDAAYDLQTWDGLPFTRELALATTASDDGEWFRFAARGGPSWTLDVTLSGLASGMSYEIVADRLPGIYGGPMGVPMVLDEDTDRRSAATVTRGGGTLHVDAAGADPNGVWWVRVRPLADPPAACPLNLRISTEPPPVPKRRR